MKKKNDKTENAEDNSNAGGAVDVSMGNTMNRCALRGKISEIYNRFCIGNDGRPIHELEAAQALTTAIDNNLKTLLHNQGIEETCCDRPEWQIPHIKFLSGMNKAGFGDLEIIFEYVIPGTSRRIDAIVFWYDEYSKDHILIVEFKRWKNADPEQVKWFIDSDGNLKQEATEGKHPLFQALGYVKLLNNFHSTAAALSMYTESMCFLPGCAEEMLKLRIANDSETAAYASLQITDDPETTACATSNNDSEAIARRINQAVDKYAVLGTDESKLEERLKEFVNQRIHQKKGSMDSSAVCDRFLSGEYEIAGKVKTEGLDKICGALERNEGNEQLSLIRGCIKEFLIEFMLAESTGDLNDKKWLIAVNIQNLIGEGRGFINSAELTMFLQHAILQTRFHRKTKVSAQTNRSSLLEIKNRLKEADPEELKTSNGNSPFDELNDGIGFNVFNAYKWDRGIFTPIGIVDCCHWQNNKYRDIAEKPGSTYRDIAREPDEFNAFLKNSKEAEIIILLVDDGTRINRVLQEKEDRLLEGFRVNCFKVWLKPELKPE